MPKAKSKSTQRATKKGARRPAKSGSQASAGSANHYAVEVIGLLGVGALIYAIFAMLLV